MYEKEDAPLLYVYEEEDARYMTSHGNKSGLGHLCTHTCNKTHACMDFLTACSEKGSIHRYLVKVMCVIYYTE